MNLERTNNVEYLEQLLDSVNRYILEYNRVLLIGNKEVISRWESTIRSVMKMDSNECCTTKLNSVKGNIKWNLVRIQPGRTFNE